MSELSTRYEPSKVEDEIYKRWLDKRLFHADETKKDEKSFSIVIPPPNVTGILHIGHALNSTLQDILIRYKRMDGCNSLWMPGTDHAGIATQNVVERDIARQGLTKEKLGREEFEKKVWEWKNIYGGKIIEQLKKIGASADWERERFTLDAGLSEAVRKVFVSLYNEKLIYKGEYIINWCPRCHTALSDIEVEHKEQAGNMWYINYRVEDSERFLTVATTRPETMLGDTALSVNPDDERYKDLIGKYAILPLVNRRIPIIADEYVDIKFGSGVLKVTPAHDPNDFLLGQKHSLKIINIFNEKAIVNEHGKPYQNLDRYTAREKIVADLEINHHLVKIEPHQHAVGRCYRCDTVIEPYLSKQWFVKIKPLAIPAVEAVKNGDIKFIPKNWENLYFNWMGNIRDWCISRQLWWGHRIPAWDCNKCNHTTVSQTDPEECENCKSTDIKQDGDVLDTWFSSALWPFSTLGWPDKTKEIETFYPTSVLVTSFDIIFFWVARMIMMGLHFTGKPPFETVYIHALVCDAHGKKMSKSAGNTIDPIETIKETGADSLRMTLAAMAIQGRDINLAKEKIITYRNFCNKLWNSARFALLNLDGFDFRSVSIERDDLDRFDRWIISRMQKTINETRAAIDSFRFNEAVNIIYQFTWKEFCDWYLEIIKLRLYGKEEGKEATQHTIVYLIRNILKLLHPIIPFITEKLWESFSADKEMIAIASYPEYDNSKVDDQTEKEIEFVMELITALRNSRGELSISASKEIDIYINIANDQKLKESLEREANLIHKLSKGNLKFINSRDEKPENSLVSVAGQVELFIDLQNLVDTKEWKEKLLKDIAKAEREVELFSKKLSNQSFVRNAKPEIVEEARLKLAGYQSKVRKLKSHFS